MGHVLENNPGNIAQALRGTNQSNTQRMFVADSGDAGGWYQAPAAQDPWQSGSDPWSQQGQLTLPAGSWSGTAAPASSTTTLWYQQSFYIGDDDEDDGTDTDTASSDGTTPYEQPLGNTAGEVTQQLFWAYQKSKAAWRQWMGKPTRSVRRFIRRRAGAVRQNKGKGRGKGAGAFLASLTDDEVDIFLGRKGKGKGKGKRTSGKGLGWKRNPIGRDGTVMT